MDGRLPELGGGFGKRIDIKDGLHYPYKNYSEEGQYAPTCQVIGRGKVSQYLWGNLGNYSGG
jgi:hypothetical protein